MRPLYLIIVAGLGILYYVSVLQREETAQVKKGEISEGDYMQEAPPSMEDTNYIKKFVPDFE